MVESSESPGSFRLGPLLFIAAVVGVAAIAFAYTAGWLSPHRLTPKKLVAGLAPPGGPALGHRRNHAKGICFTGTFEANGAGAALSRAAVFAPGQYPVVGRFNLATADPNAADAMVRVRGIGVSITTPDGQEWRMALIDAPIFPVSTPQGFYALLTASGSKDPNAMKNFIAAHPEFLSFVGWAKSAPWTGSYAEERYNSLNSFLLVDGTGAKHTIRWSLVPAAQPVPVSPEELAKRGPDPWSRKLPSVSFRPSTVDNGGDSSPIRVIPRRILTRPGLRIGAQLRLARLPSSKLSRSPPVRV